MLKQTLIQAIASKVIAQINCKKSGNDLWFERHQHQGDDLAKEHFPHGSGFDNDSLIDWARSKPDRIVLTTSFHHMTEHGYYNGWTEHDIIITPSLAHDFYVKVTGRDKNDIKEYIADCFSYALEQDVIEGNPTNEKHP